MSEDTMNPDEMTGGDEREVEDPGAAMGLGPSGGDSFTGDADAPEPAIDAEGIAQEGVDPETGGRPGGAEAE